MEFYQLYPVISQIHSQRTGDSCNATKLQLEPDQLRLSESESESVTAYGRRTDRTAGRGFGPVHYSAIGLVTPASDRPKLRCRRGHSFGLTIGGVLR